LAPILWNNFTGKKGYRNLKGNIQIVKNLSRKYETFAGALEEWEKLAKPYEKAWRNPMPEHGNYWRSIME
jgi:hypothetical protein